MSQNQPVLDVPTLVTKATELLQDELFPFAAEGSRVVQEVEICGYKYELLVVLAFKK